MNIQAYVIHWRFWLLLLLSALVAGYAGAYPDLNPASFHLQAAIIAFVLAFTTFVVYHVSATNAQLRIAMLERRPAFSSRGQG
jgi:hypothetical membrane protein